MPKNDVAENNKASTTHGNMICLNQMGWWSEVTRYRNCRGLPEPHERRRYCRQCPLQITTKRCQRTMLAPSWNEKSEILDCRRDREIESIHGRAFMEGTNLCRGAQPQHLPEWSAWRRISSNSEMKECTRERSRVKSFSSLVAKVKFGKGRIWTARAPLEVQMRCRTSACQHAVEG